MSDEFFVIWKSEPGSRVSTTVDAHDKPVLRDAEYITSNDILIVRHERDLLGLLGLASGVKYAVAPELARSILGWDV